jgi:hypothetical protein
MPADVSIQSARQISQAPSQASTSRLPIGLGLTVAACLSVGLWIIAAAGFRALFL